MSVVGWNSILLGNWVVIAFFIVLDMAKLVSVSFVYQTWHEIKKIWRGYLIAAVTFLMLLTSAGAFGYLSSSFQDAFQSNKQISLSLDAEKNERTQLQADKTRLIESKSKIENQIAQLPSNSVRGRETLINRFRGETNRINTELANIDKRLGQINSSILDSSKQQISKDVHIGPIVYVANTFNLSVEVVVTIAILMLVFVFDPLAISLILAGNFLINRRKNNMTHLISKPVTPPITPIHVPEPEVTKPTIVPLPNIISDLITKEPEKPVVLRSGLVELQSEPTIDPSILQGEPVVLPDEGPQISNPLEGSTLSEGIPPTPYGPLAQDSSTQSEKKT